jgi:uncharacterized protein
MVHRHDALQGTTGGHTTVEGYAGKGFTVNGVAMDGPVLLLPKASFLFSPLHFEELTTQSLAILDLLDTPISMVVIGCGRRSRRLPPAIREWLDARGTAVETLATPHASATFNFMVQEQRSVAGVLFPLDADSIKAAEPGAGV